MTYVAIDFDKAVEPSPLPEGHYPTQITGAEVKQTGPNSKNPGRDMLVFTVGFTGTSDEELNAPTVNHYVSLPYEDDEPKSANFKTLQLKRFLVTYNIPFEASGIDLEEICFAAIGAAADMDVTLSEPDDNGRVYNRLRLPRLPD